MLNLQAKIRAEIKAKLDMPCDDAKSQRIHDLLASFDALFADGHTKACGVGQVWAERPCECGL